MGWLSKKLGYGVTGTIDGDHPNDAPHVTVDNTPLPVSGSVTTVGSPSATRSDTYTGTGTGTTVDGSAFIPQSYSLEVSGTGSSPSAWNVVLEGSIDSVNFTILLIHTQATGNGQILLSGANLYPMLSFRSRVISLTLGPASNIVVTIVGKG